MRRFEIAASVMLSRDEKIRRIERTYVEDAQLVFATLSGVSTLLTSLGGDDVTFDTTVIDEAAQVCAQKKEKRAGLLDVPCPPVIEWVRTEREWILGEGHSQTK